MEINDKQLVKNFLEGGDDQAFELLVDRHLKPVYNFLYRFISDPSTLDDVTQETFIKVWKNMRRFDENKSFKTWIFTIAKNTAYDWLKKKKTVPFSKFIDPVGGNALENISTDEILPDEVLARVDLAKDFEEKLNKLPDQYRIILLMHYKDDFSLQEIAKILEKPYNTIKSQHQRALQKLRNILL